MSKKKILRSYIYIYVIMYTYIILHPISLLLCILTCKYSRYYDLLEMSNSMKNIVDKTLKKKKTK